MARAGKKNHASLWTESDAMKVNLSFQSVL